MIIRANDIRLQITNQGKAEIILTADEKRVDISKLKQAVSRGKHLTAEIKQYRRKRSQDANSYCWVLCQKIAEAIGSTKEQVYQTFIKRVGQFEIVPIKNEAVDRWIDVWKTKGLGWHSEVLSDSKLDGYKKVISYYGSSVYNTREMSVLIDEIVTQCQELGIETMTPDELADLKSRWGKTK